MGHSGSTRSDVVQNAIRDGIVGIEPSKGIRYYRETLADGSVAVKAYTAKDPMEWKNYVFDYVPLRRPPRGLLWRAFNWATGRFIRWCRESWWWFDERYWHKGDY